MILDAIQARLTRPCPRCTPAGATRGPGCADCHFTGGMYDAMLLGDARALLRLVEGAETPPPEALRRRIFAEGGSILARHPEVLCLHASSTFVWHLLLKRLGGRPGWRWYAVGPKGPYTWEAP